MTISPLEIYLISLVDKIDAITEVIIFLGGLASGILFTFWMMGKAESYKTEDEEHYCSDQEEREGGGIGRIDGDGAFRRYCRRVCFNILGDDRSRRPSPHLCRHLSSSSTLQSRKKHKGQKSPLQPYETPKYPLSNKIKVSNTGMYIKSVVFRPVA